MIDTEKLIKAWEVFRDSNPYQLCEGKEFRAIKEPEYLMSQMIEDTLTALNKGIPKEVNRHPAPYGYPFNTGSCPVCMKQLDEFDEFCRACGQAVKW